MRVEEIALRQEIRQMLNEAGYNKNTLKDLVKDVMHEELRAAVKQACNETDINRFVHNELKTIVAKSARAELQNKITDRLMNRWINSMHLDITIDSKFDELVEEALDE